MGVSTVTRLMLQFYFNFIRHEEDCTCEWKCLSLGVHPLMKHEAVWLKQGNSQIKKKIGNYIYVHVDMYL